MAIVLFVRAKSDLDSAGDLWRSLPTSSWSWPVHRV